MALTYQLSNGKVTGFIYTKAVTFVLRPATAGSTPPAGNYELRFLGDDPDYGKVGLLAPEIRRSSPRFILFDRTPIKAAPDRNLCSRDPAFCKDTNPTPIAPNIAPYSPVYNVSGDLYVLSGRAVKGKKSLVVTSGLADMIDALVASGGFTPVTVR